MYKYSFMSYFGAHVLTEGFCLQAICLVGGFGSSHYLKACVESQYPDIHILQPNEAWAAIAK